MDFVTEGKVGRLTQRQPDYTNLDQKEQPIREIELIDRSPENYIFELETKLKEALFHIWFYNQYSPTEYGLPVVEINSSKLLWEGRKLLFPDRHKPFNQK